MCKYGLLYLVASAIAVLCVQLRFVDCINERKKNGITIEFRKLNTVTYNDKYPIPNTKDCLQSLSNVHWLSCIDLNNSFYQVQIWDVDRDKTAFITRKDQFRLKHLAMGCCNSPMTFSRLMAMGVSGLNCCLAFIDDTIVFSSLFEQHLKNVQLLFD